MVQHTYYADNTISTEVLDWLLSGDAAIIYQVNRDILHAKAGKLEILQNRISKEGWGKQFLAYRKKDGQWGDGLYPPKWTSTHYTLLDIKNLGFPTRNKEVRTSVGIVLESEKGKDGGINYSWKHSDVCVNGMILNFGAYFLPGHDALSSIVDFLLRTQMKDGGWNCDYLEGATHSSLHTTISVLEGLLEYQLSGNSYRTEEIKRAQDRGIEFILIHKLFKSHRTGEVIDTKMLMLSYPSRWRYDILRALDYFQKAKVPYDTRMKDALQIIRYKQRFDGLWPLQARHSGKVHFDMEKAGTPSRWNTLRALRVLHHFNSTLPV
jgi:hypothetical protein